MRLKYWLPTILWMIVIFSFSARPALQASGVDWQDFLLKKTAHFIEYFILAFLLYRSLKNTTNFSPPVLFMLSLTISVLYASSDEYHQSFVPGREPHLRDVVIDSLGALSASCLSPYIFKRDPKHTLG